MKITDVILKYPAVLGKRDFIIDAFSITTHTEKSAVPDDGWYVGKVFSEGNKVMVYLGDDTYEQLTVGKQPYTSFEETGTLPAGILKNAPKPIKTTLGRVALNYLLLSEPFGDAIPYVNEPWNSGKIERQIVEALLDGTIDVKSVYTYVDNVYYLGSYSDFCVPSLSSKAVTIDPKVIARRDALLKQYAGQLDDPKVMMAIEKELIALDMATMKGDVSNGFMITNKSYDNHRKRMFLNIGMVNKFGEDVGHDFISSSLDDGWDPKELPKIANEIRSGSYSRGKETAKGGDIAKQLGRNFQEAAIVMDDCKTANTMPTLISDSNQSEFLHRNIMVAGKVVALTKENISKYLDKVVQLRSPMTCVAKNGYCYTCMDNRFKILKVTLLNTQLLQIGSKIMLNSMKAMHSVKVTAYELQSLDEFTV